MNDNRLFRYQGNTWAFTEFYMETDFGTDRGSQIKGTFVCNETNETRTHVFSNVECLPPCVEGASIEQRAVYSLIKGLYTNWDDNVAHRYKRLYTLKKENTVCRVYVTKPRVTLAFTYTDGAWTKTQEITSFDVSWLDGARNEGSVEAIDNPFESSYSIDRLYPDTTNSSSIYERIVSILTELI